MHQDFEMCQDFELVGPNKRGNWKQKKLKGPPKKPVKDFKYFNFWNIVTYSYKVKKIM